MRRTNSFTIEQEGGSKLEVTVYEIRPYDLLKLHREIQQQQLPVGEYERLLPFCTNLKRDQLAALYPNEMAKMIEQFKEVNSDFFAPWPSIKAAINRLGLVGWATDLLQQSGMLETLKKAISTDLRKLFASLPNEGIGSLSDTGGGISESALSLEEGKGSSKSKPKPPRHLDS